VPRHGSPTEFGRAHQLFPNLLQRVDQAVDSALGQALLLDSELINRSRGVAGQLAADDAVPAELELLALGFGRQPVSP
jgi:hypothetical protein